MPIMQTVIQGGGTTPTGTKSITANGVYDVTNFASADVQVPTTAPAHYVEFDVQYGTLKKKLQQVDFTGISNPSDSLSMVFSGVRLSSNFTFSFFPITTISSSSALNQMFYGVTGGTSYNLTVDMSSITSISGTSALQNMFFTSTFGGTGRLFVSLTGLETITGSWAFQSAFKNTALESISFDKLSTITQDLAPSGNEPFADCRLLNSVSFGGLKSTTFSSKVTQLKLFNSNTGSQATNGCTVHFPSNFDPSDPDHTFDVTTLTGYPTFGGSASYIHIAFDLPATE